MRLDGRRGSFNWMYPWLWLKLRPGGKEGRQATLSLCAKKSKWYHPHTYLFGRTDIRKTSSKSTGIGRSHDSSQHPCIFVDGILLSCSLPTWPVFHSVVFRKHFCKNILKKKHTYNNRKYFTKKRQSLIEWLGKVEGQKVKKEKNKTLLFWTIPRDLLRVYYAYV